VQWSLVGCAPVLSLPAMGAAVLYCQLPAIEIASWPVLPTHCILPHVHHRGRYVDCNVAERLAIGLMDYGVQGSLVSRKIRYNALGHWCR